MSDVASDTTAPIRNESNVLEEDILQIIETARLRHKYQVYNQIRLDMIEFNKQVIEERMMTYSFNQEDA